MSAVLVMELILATFQVIALSPTKTINQLGHNVWSTQNGLPGNAVNVALQTSDGYLWFGMGAGLFRFDGEAFERVSTIPGDNANSESVSSLCEASDSSLWVGTSFSQLRRMKDDSMVVYGDSAGLLSRNINCIVQSSSGEIWIGTSYGLYRFTGSGFVDINIAPRYITAIVEDASGRIWAGTHQGIRIIEGDSVVDSLDVTIDGHSQLITALYRDRKGTMWAGGYEGLVHFEKRRVVRYTRANGLSDSHVTALFEDRDGNLWVGTNAGGLNRLSSGNWSSYSSSEGLSSNHVLSITEDHEGSLWVCTLDGLDRFKDVNVTPFTREEGLASDFISSVAETPDGSIYFLSDETATIMRLKKGKVSQIRAPVGPAFVSRDGSLWVGQTGSLSVIRGGKAKVYGVAAGLPPKWITAISEDAESIILYITDVGIRRFEAGRLLPYELKPGTPYRSMEYVACFYPDRSGALWIGTSRGLVRIADGVAKTFGPNDGMADYWVSHIYDDERGSLWIASPHGGLTRFRNNKFTVYDSKVGLFTDEIYCVLSDGNGDLWLSSPRGIGHVARRDLDDFELGRTTRIHTEVFVAADGMKTDECFGQWQPGAWRARDGKLWFATKKGAVVIDPRSFTRNDLVPPVFITHALADGKAVDGGGHCSLSPETGNLEFHYAALSYVAPERVKFMYKLEGYDPDFVDAGNRHVAYYTNLPPGTYRFRVRACNNDGIWNEQGAGFDFILLPHFYQTYWFYACTIAALFGSGFGIYRLRVWQLLRREKELEQRVQESLNKIKVLGGLIPICSECKKIRDDKGYWDLLEGYIQSHSEAKFSHALCPDCASKLYPDVFPPEEKG
ncbi:MAG TPA: two-component regulator propeller domain-containing protein [Bacteroidota bacterium]|nr:two-component regulator propeller domain-containing protein [Bacteroidota bacterium]